MNYYKVSLLRSSAPELTYCSEVAIDLGSIVTISLKTTQKSAVVVKEVEKPTFETFEIISISNSYYNTNQIEIAKFIAQYYFSSFSEAISLFIPYPKESTIPKPMALNTTNSTLELSSMQKEAYEKLLKKDKALLFGVTGSGKTEIFIALMFKILEEKKSCIFLMPEISLTPQMEKRLKVYFGDAVAMWHSKLTKNKKTSILKGIEDGTVQIVAGARSALFVPLSNLGLIVVDEEHDDSYKAMTRPRYNARDIAVLMAHKLGAKVLLASATPSIGSYYKYDVVKLEKPYRQTKKSYRFIIGNSINSTILNTIKRHYKNGDQSLVFLPTRGNFKYLYCEGCGKTHLCPYCSVGMALHRKYRHLKCHYCNFTEAIVDTCTQCGHTPLKSNRMGTVEAIDIIENAIEALK